jgi:hypothetical protein
MDRICRIHRMNRIFQRVVGRFLLSRTTVRAGWGIPCFVRIHRIDRIDRIFERVVGRFLLFADHSPC